jgi:hypothetical protein
VRQAPDSAGSSQPPQPAEAGAERPAARSASPDTYSRVWYAVGLVVQSLLWLAILLAIVLAVLGSHGLTQFRYVGF